MVLWRYPPQFAKRFFKNEVSNHFRNATYRSKPLTSLVAGLYTIVISRKTKLATLVHFDYSSIYQNFQKDSSKNEVSNN